MNSDQIGGIIRAVLTAVGGGLVAKGYVDAGQLQIIIGAVVALIGTGWSIYSNSTASLVRSVATKPEVQAVVAPKLRELVNDPDLSKVVATKAEVK